MRAALEARGRAPSAAGLAGVGTARVGLAAGALAVTAAAVLVGGGSSAQRLSWIGAAAVVLAAAAAFAVPPLGRPGLLLAGALAATAAWATVTIGWSIAPDRSWDAANRAFAYLAFLVLGMAAGRLGIRVVAAALAALAGVAAAWALAGMAVPALGPDTERVARLRAPVGYWNSLALLLVTALPLGLWLAGRREHRPVVRAAGTALVFAALLGLLLTTSRGGILVAAVAVVVWLALTRRRLESVVTLVLAGVPALAIGVWTLAATMLVDASPRDAARAADARVFGALVLAGAVLVTGAALAAARRPPRDAHRRILARGLAGVAAFFAVVLVAAFLVSVGNPVAWAGDVVDEFRNPPGVEVSQGPGRLTETSSNHRWTWWTQAWQIFRANPARGAGAGAYDLARRPLREDTEAPIDPHNVALLALSETGLVGCALLVALVGAAAFVGRDALRRLRGGERAAAGALVSGAVAYLAHALVDMPWQFVAVSAPLFVALGALATAGKTAAPLRPPPLAAALAAAAAALALVASLVSPALAEERVDAAVAALTNGDLDGARDAARRARAFDPLSIEPIHVEAAAAEFAGELDDAERLYRKAVEVQPRNARTWYELGRFEFEARGDLASALLYADRSYALDSWPSQTGDLLNAIRAELARG